MIEIAPGVRLDPRDVAEEFVRAGGPGGQNVNKVSSAVHLRYDLAQAQLPPDVKQRLRALAGRRLTAAGQIILQASRHRTQVQNRQDAWDRLVELLRRAAQPPRRRRATRPTGASKLRRLDAKRRRGQDKRLRRDRED